MIRAVSNGDRPAARELELRGVVQGVGFRPFVHRLAAGLGLAGSVRNEAGAVRITVEGRPPTLDAFQERLTLDAPPLARIHELEVRGAPATGRRGFTVAASDTAPRGRLPVSPDVALCSACEAELFDPGDRRYRYPFITCTDCGPRFTVIEAMPYDRERSTMGAFVQCPRCRTEYTDPSDRRYHSETNSCPECGPELVLEGADGEELGRRDDALVGAGVALRTGFIVAVRGLGGFHLAVDATDEDAVRRLRERKSREAKPLAIMVPTLHEARRWTEVDLEEAALLTSPERPIVLLRRRPDAALARTLAPGLDTVGV
ncbi:MAG: carbamoyltransferase HypF, partial [Gemmatimonadetes bacterium]|nr:carbamoyltransferase HypF [Gemmatimonadota bacterium]NIR78549.1 carbamoyltransferase HypF [Gemmatimonadota bacterium]NIT87172.1 carbamoyltransferase HypF [Gemmatimonadota bacterium]NIU31003.1 carbamoyltransferase HypF [Gemmatimonadota bacterium]NIU35757.1 carbamoyltransferase HypF [Gemmatimonadota bacterium]